MIGPVVFPEHLVLRQLLKGGGRSLMQLNVHVRDHRLPGHLGVLQAQLGTRGKRKDKVVQSVRKLLTRLKREEPGLQHREVGDGAKVRPNFPPQHVVGDYLPVEFGLGHNCA